MRNQSGDQTGRQPPLTQRIRDYPYRKRRVLRLLREAWQQIERQYFSIDVCWFFLESLPLEEVKRYLKIRQTGLQATLEHVRTHRNEQLSPA
jgi:hypothetical protein